jgi:hypothetical protein
MGAGPTLAVCVKTKSAGPFQFRGGQVQRKFGAEANTPDVHLSRRGLPTPVLQISHTPELYGVAQFPLFSANYDWIWG